MPTPFKSEFAAETSDCVEAELAVHRRLAKFRINDYREFFDVPMNLAKAAIEEEVRRVDAKLGVVSQKKPEPRIIIRTEEIVLRNGTESQLQVASPPPIPSVSVESPTSTATASASAENRVPSRRFFEKRNAWVFWWFVACAALWFLPAAVAFLNGALTIPGATICFGMAAALFYFGAIRMSKH